MTTQSHVVGTSPQRVWEVLADGWLYPLFVVGASRMRSVDETWPERGARLHHSIGAWPALIDDTTQVVECRPHHLLRLRAHGWPAGAAEVVLRLREVGSGTEVEMTEDVVAGPGLLVPRLVRSPPIHWRNRETLRRLGLVCEGRAGAS